MTFAELVKKYIPLPWASGSTLKNDIPATRSTGLPSNRATYTEGFPEITMQPVLKNSDNTLQAGSGIPPSGYDFNGVLNTVTNEIYNNKLMGLAYGDWDSTVSTTYGGYPQGAIVSYPAGAQTNKTFYLSLVDNNTSTPSSSAQWKSILPSITIYPSSQNINGSINCWVRTNPDGFIQQGGMFNSVADYNLQIIQLIQSYSQLHMGVSLTVIPATTRSNDNDPSTELGAYSCSATSSGLTGSVAYTALQLNSFSAKFFRVAGSGNDPVSVIWTSWGY